ncbi:hypothetical protein QN355_09045 [Cryobacterium sp. 10S3]|uniref:hypothetical protein n=1 Tax=unclassified Cryobacterium TaxID=2649013 RepID=UPI002AC9028F|nr:MULTISPECIES: hypothetical protein [unclassified Cryobacterium]MEB0001664.1 hypothetical protein [Cryobacterium sp. RTC2.1]MEB0286695.1 hypothetical protein [Cryobacterium sp. 10S3]WPX13184.1 hypothetical protein RHM57_16165 [Cryobacterium sp. 10S3]
MSTLTGQSGGRFAIETASGSTYWLDLDRAVMRRLPTVDDRANEHELRRDGAEVALLRVVECSIGQPMHLIINLRVAGVVATSRRTTTVMAITQLDPAGPNEGTAT